MPADPKNDMNAAESFLDDVLSSYILAASCDILGIDSSAHFLKSDSKCQPHSLLLPSFQLTLSKSL